MLLITGLGNPESDHANNRHNIGFMAIDAIAKKYGASFKKNFGGLAAQATIAGKKCLLLKPQTFMNESGRSIIEAVSFYKIPPENVIIFHDELDLAAGKLRMKQGGGHAGHNGVRSAINHIGDNFHRARLGIGHPGQSKDVHGYVLSDFSKKDKDWLVPFLDALAGEVEMLVEGKNAAYQTRIAHLCPVQESKP